MRCSIRILFVLVVVVMSFVSVQAVQAQEVEPPVTGKVVSIDVGESTIVIMPDEAVDSIVIEGFPCGNLSLQLLDILDGEGDFVPGDCIIETNDCVTVDYYLQIPKDEEKEPFNKFLSLLMYCNYDICEGDTCTDCFDEKEDLCFGGDGGELTREPYRNKGEEDQHKARWKQYKNNPIKQ